MTGLSGERANQNIGFKDFCDFLYKESGITITPDKAYLVSSRTRHIMQEYQLDTIADIVAALHDKELQQKIIDAMTTNETFWFRDGYPFDYFLQKLLPYWNNVGYKESSIRIWNAACSSGQEPYSLAMLCEEYRMSQRMNQGRMKNVEIVATDLSSEILNKAKAACYDHLSIERGLSEERLDNFFDVNDNNQWQLSAKIRRYVKFEALNLLNSYSSLGKFDLIFCRNVLIYFDYKTKTDILIRLHQALKPHGLLFLGSSENLADASALFSIESCKPGIAYRALGK